MNNLAIKQRFSNFRYQKSERQAVDFHSPVFVQDRADACCRVSKQYKIDFARSENDDVMKQPCPLRNVCGFAVWVLSSFAALKCSLP